MKKDLIDISPILTQKSNHSISLKTPLFRHKSPDISNRQKKKKFRKRILNLNKSHVNNRKGTGKRGHVLIKKRPEMSTTRFFQKCLKWHKMT